MRVRGAGSEGGEGDIICISCIYWMWKSLRGRERGRKGGRKGGADILCAIGKMEGLLFSAGMRDV